MKHNNLTVILLCLPFLFFITACQPIQPKPHAQSIPFQLTLQTANEQKRNATEIFSAISPAVAFIDTPTGTGSGVLIQGKYLLSNAHVVWPFDKVRVVFADGSEYKAAPVFAWDLVADLALIGPIDTKLQPVALVDGSKLAVGSDIYLIGYPAEVDKFPKPTITNGILSHVRKWDAIDYHFFQVDATITGGQSGGVLVTQQGDVIGISTFYYNKFGLAGSVADALVRLNALLKDKPAAMLATRGLPGGEGAKQQLGKLRNQWDVQRYVMLAPLDTKIDLQITGSGRPKLSVTNVLGDYIDSTTNKGGVNEAELSFTVENPAPYIIEVSQSASVTTTFTLKSSYPLVYYPDPDDGATLVEGKTWIGNMDVAGDSDYFSLQLKAGEVVSITVDSLELDPYLSLHYDSPALQESVSDDNSAGGIFGEGANLIYKAPKDGVYTLLVSDNNDNSIGGYFMTMAKASPTAQAMKPDVHHELVSSTFGRLAWYESKEHGFAVRYPLDWQVAAPSKCGQSVSKCIFSAAGTIFIIEEDLSQLDKADRTQDGYIRLLKDLLQSNNAKVVSVEPFKTLQGLSANKILITAQAGRFTTLRFVYVDEEAKMAFNVGFTAATATFDKYKQSAEAIIGDSLRQWQNEDRTSSPVFHFDQGLYLATDGELEQAIAEYSQSIKLDPKFVQAYKARSWSYRALGKSDEALADMGRALELLPDSETYYSRASVRWTARRFEDALSDIEQAIRLDAKRPEWYNMSALINISLGNSKAALQNMDKYAELNGGELGPQALDTRGFVYLKMGEWTKAKADYEAAFKQNFRSIYPLLGGGISYAKLGDKQQARSLIEEGLAKMNAAKIVRPDPQLTDLLDMAHKVLDTLK